MGGGKSESMSPSQFSVNSAPAPPPPNIFQSVQLFIIPEISG